MRHAAVRRCSIGSEPVDSGSEKKNSAATRGSTERRTETVRVTWKDGTRRREMKDRPGIGSGTSGSSMDPRRRTAIVVLSCTDQVIFAGDAIKIEDGGIQE